MKYLSFSLLICFLPLYSSLLSQDSIQNNYPDTLNADPYDTLSVSVQNVLFKLIKAEEKLKPVKIKGEKIIGNPVITGLYQNVNYMPVWTDSVNRNDLIRILKDSYFEGLDPEDYHFDYIRKHNNQLRDSTKLKTKELAQADIIMTDAILTYAYHLIKGKVHPVELDPTWNYGLRSIPDSAEINLLSLLENRNLKDGIDSLRSELPLYARLKFWFAHYDSLNKAKAELTEIEYPGKPLRLGDTSQVVIELKNHLLNFGFRFDTIDSVFNEELDSCLQEFQMLNGLDADGVAGKKTFKTLNISLKDRLDIIRVNLERSRWIGKKLPEKNVLVNIADYTLYIFNRGAIDYSCRVVVGKEQNKTPVFTSDIKYIVFNPTWTVPYSIATNEILPKLKRDANYLQNRNMTLLKGGAVINPSTVDWSHYSKKNFPFTIRQEPGPNNALGLVKFMFPNKHAVYLHDTPAKSYFKRAERAFSHGCVRVQDPLILAEYLLKDKGYDQNKIAEVLKTGKLKNIYLKEGMPVLIMYWTCYVSNRDGKMYFYRDVYGRDNKMLRELKRSK